MKNPLKKAVWSPYSVGIGIGILSWITFLFMAKGLAITTAFVRFVGFFIGIFSPYHIANNPYFAKYVEFRPVFEWQCALFFGVLLGAYISARLSGAKLPKIPQLWVQNFGPSLKKRAFFSFLGGFLLIFGARIAGGCTLGHGITGGIQLATESFLFLMMLFSSGALTAIILYRKKTY